MEWYLEMDELREEGVDLDNNEMVVRLRQFMEDEARSCSMDFGCVTPMYVYRMWGGDVSLEEITAALTALKQQGYDL